MKKNNFKKDLENSILRVKKKNTPLIILILLVILLVGSLFTYSLLENHNVINGEYDVSPTDDVSNNGAVKGNTVEVPVPVVDNKNENKQVDIRPNVDTKTQSVSYPQYTDKISQSYIADFNKTIASFNTLDGLVTLGNSASQGAYIAAISNVSGISPSSRYDLTSLSVSTFNIVINIHSLLDNATYRYSDARQNYDTYIFFKNSSDEWTRNQAPEYLLKAENSRTEARQKINQANMELIGMPK